MSSAHDALIIGGGPAGATTAILLARAGWDVAVLERKAFPRRKVCGEYLSGTSLPLLTALGIREGYEAEAGPDVKRVGLFGREMILTADLPRPGGAEGQWGRALSREKLDTLLLDQARKAGAEVYQPWTASTLVQEGEGYLCMASGGGTDKSLELRARVVIGAHGSWERGELSAQPERNVSSPDDLLGFKAHFRGSSLPADLMPLVVFPGGYGGMVTCDEGQVSLSFCIRRDELARARQQESGSAGEAAFAHILRSCKGVRQTLQGAIPEGAWLGAGPIRPGIRLKAPTGIFLVGNAAGEAHPIVAEGISMAIQGGWLLSEALRKWRQGGSGSLRPAAHAYHSAWRRAFAPRLYASAVLAQWGMRPAAVSMVAPVLRLFPSLLSLGARLTGKAAVVIQQRPQGG